jgi:hypothetical protein
MAVPVPGADNAAFLEAGMMPPGPRPMRMVEAIAIVPVFEENAVEAPAMGVAIKAIPIKRPVKAMMWMAELDADPEIACLRRLRRRAKKARREGKTEKS